MHELAVCQGLMNQVEQIARRENAECVTRILLSVGPLSGVEAQLLIDAFSIASAGTVAEGAVLVIEEQAVRVKCLSCGAESDVRPNRLLCGSCGDFRTRLISGDEMMLMSLELERRENA
ncbi:MAG: hydrogenase maturation nickel metallochaperone HypA [Sedimenticolaceae bacterium]|jgi:hydrogenase nickel incorporation protein HypA/HybF